MRKGRMKLFKKEEEKHFGIAMTVIAAMSIIVVTVSYVIIVAIQTNNKMRNTSGGHKFALFDNISHFIWPPKILKICWILQISAKKTSLALGV